MNTLISLSLRRLILFVCLLPASLQAQQVSQPTPKQVRFNSGPAQVGLLELYTSEGCSSCPPADRWLSRIKSDPRLWRELVPIAFHVDYWNYLGWRDRFARSEYSQRQRRYAREYQEPTVYTPGLRWNGDEWRDWRGVTAPVSDEIGEVGVLQVAVLESGQFNAQFNPVLQPNNKQPYTLTVAVLGMELASNVARGENRGRVLQHDFVVLGLSRFAEQAAGKWSGALPRAEQAATRYALAAWVTQGNRLTPVQATGGYLDRDFLR